MGSVKPVFSLVSYVILIKMKQFVVLLFVFASSNSAKVENWSNPNLEGSLQPNSKSSARNGKFLGTYGITSTTTSTLSAYTYCYTSAAAISTVCDRKKRSIEDAPIDDESHFPDMISPSSAIKKQNEEEIRKNYGKSIPISKLQEL